jgi:hypothetical protein
LAICGQFVCSRLVAVFGWKRCPPVVVRQSGAVSKTHTHSVFNDSSSTDRSAFAFNRAFGDTDRSAFANY